MRCLVTGGAGFIGSHLVDALLAEGHGVRVIDNFATGRPENLEAARASSRFELQERDVVESPEALAEPFAGIDWVFHLAALADIVPSIERPEDYHHANVDGTFSVLEASRRAGVKRFVYAASSSCYGIPDTFPTPEDAPARPEYPYALTKYLGEQYVLAWAKIYGLPALTLRLFNVYGPRSRTTGAYGAVFGVFLAQKLAGRPFTVVGDGEQTRDFVFVSDVVEAFLAAARSDRTGLAMNVGTGEPQSINRLVELIGGEVEHIPKRPGEPACTCADVSRIWSALGWQARVSFTEGVAKMLARLEDWRDARVWTAGDINTATASWFRYLGGREQA